MKKPSTGVAPYEMTDAEREIVSAWDGRRKSTAARRPSWRLRADANGRAVETNHPNEGIGRVLIMVALNISRSEVLSHLVNRLAELSLSNGAIDIHHFNALFDMVASFQPADDVEVMLASQMVAVHDLTMRSAVRAKHAESMEVRESTERGVNKPARTFTMQVEALKRHRGSGEQKVVVEHRHYHVHPGAQAVFGDVNTVKPGGDHHEIAGQPHEIEHNGMLLSERAAVLGAIEADGLPLPGTGDEGLERLPLPRRPRRPKARSGQ